MGGYTRTFTETQYPSEFSRSETFTRQLPLQPQWLETPANVPILHNNRMNSLLLFRLKLRVRGCEEFDRLVGFHSHHPFDIRVQHCGVLSYRVRDGGETSYGG